MRRGLATWPFVGHDNDQPVSERRKARYNIARSCLSLDATAFDRRMPKWLIEEFYYYMNCTSMGVHPKVWEYLCRVTIHSTLVCSDGSSYVKSQGNPSGFMNTLRLNCFASMYVWVSVLHDVALEKNHVSQNAGPLSVQNFLYDNFHLEVCGDDTRLWRLSDLSGFGDEVLMEKWNVHYPWNMKIEGTCTFDRDVPLWLRLMNAPPMVSRAFVPIELPGGSTVLFEPLFDAGRVLKRLLHDTHRDSCEELQLVISVAAALIIPLYANKKGWLQDPELKAFNDKHWDDVSFVVYGKLSDMLNTSVPQVHHLEDVGWAVGSC